MDIAEEAEAYLSHMQDVIEECKATVLQAIEECYAEDPELPHGILVHQWWTHLPEEEHRHVFHVRAERSPYIPAKTIVYCTQIDPRECETDHTFAAAEWDQ